MIFLFFFCCCRFWITAAGVIRYLSAHARRTEWNDNDEGIDIWNDPSISLFIYLKVFFAYWYWFLFVWWYLFSSNESRTSIYGTHETHEEYILERQTTNKLYHCQNLNPPQRNGINDLMYFHCEFLDFLKSLTSA